MDTRTGEIMAKKDLLERLGAADFKKYAKPVNVQNLTKRARNDLIQIGHHRLSQNSRCACGSGKRFKRCCMSKETNNAEK